jgi:predicted amidophosphoribosyltransferase
MARVARSDPSVSVQGPVRVVVPVPTTSSRLRARGYNQAGLLADRVGARLGLPVGDALERVRGDVSQTALTPEERRSNVRGAFRCSGPVRGASVLLVDDVLTTGATAGEAATTLVAAGADRVVLVAFARALAGAGRLREGSAGLAA